MLTRTHLAITVFGILLVISLIENKFVFVLTALIATLIPDIDCYYSYLGKHVVFRPLQWFTKHRGILHSFSFLILITIFFVLFIPVLAAGFFLGYGLHLFSDSFTKDGIQIFYPFKKKISGKLRTGSLFETGLFVVFILFDLLLLSIKLGFL